MHFFLLGGLVFGLHASLQGAALGTDRPLQVDAQKRAELAALFAQRMARSPSSEELNASEARWLEEEALFREALRLELPESDPNLRDQLIARMRALLQASIAPRPPERAELARYHAAHRERYRVPATATFVEYLVPPGSQADDAARDLLRRLRTGETVREVPVTHSQRSDSELAALYGPELPAKIRALPIADWQLLRSARGLHVVRLDALSEARDPSTEELRPRISADMQADLVRERFHEQLQKLVARWGESAHVDAEDSAP